VRTWRKYKKGLKNSFILQKQTTKKHNDMVLKGLVICASGTLSVTRKQFEELVEENGGSFSNTVTKRVTHLVCDQSEFDNVSSKVAKARGEGIPIVNEDFVNDSIGTLFTYCICVTDAAVLFYCFKLIYAFNTHCINYIFAILQRKASSRMWTTTCLKSVRDCDLLLILKFFFNNPVVLY